MLRSGLVLALAGAALAAPSRASAVSLLSACGGTTTANCVVSVARNGAPIPYPSLVTDPYQVRVAKAAPPSNENYYLSVERTMSGPTLDLSDVWELVVNTGSSYPGETFAHRRNVTVVRGGGAGGNPVDLSLQP